MRYLITQADHEPFITEWFNSENHYVKGMIVYDFLSLIYSVDGENWKDIIVDHL